MAMQQRTAMSADPSAEDSSKDIDARLMERLRNDDLALNLIMERWAERVAAFLYKMTGSHSVAADLAQETFVKLYQSRERYRPSGVFSSYLFGIAANLARNHRRWRNRHPTVSLDDPDFHDGGLHVTNSFDQLDPHQSSVSGESIHAILEAVLALPVDLREAITLFIDEGMSQAEIGLALGCTPKAVETRIYRARQILKTKLSQLHQP